MANMIFKFGAMNSGKTRDLLKTRYNYLEQGKDVLIIKPANDDKGDDCVQARGMDLVKADYLIGEEDNIYLTVCYCLTKRNIDCILVDEAQFFDKKKIEELSDVADYLDIPVICYAVRSNFKEELFPGTKALFETANVLETLETLCSCGDKAIYNLRYVNGELTFEGEEVAIDGKDNVNYKSYCRKCVKKLKKQYYNK